MQKSTASKWMIDPTFYIFRNECNLFYMQNKQKYERC